MLFEDTINKADRILTYSKTQGHKKQSSTFKIPFNKYKDPYQL